jgi:hypothetical protein
MSSTSPRHGTTPTLRYRRDVRPLRFPDSDPEEQRVPEGKAHVIRKTALWMILRAVLRPANSIACDQFVYWLANNSRGACAPDGSWPRSMGSTFGLRVVDASGAPLPTPEEQAQ